MDKAFGFRKIFISFFIFVINILSYNLSYSTNDNLDLANKLSQPNQINQQADYYHLVYQQESLADKAQVGNTKDIPDTKKVTKNIDLAYLDAESLEYIEQQQPEAKKSDNAKSSEESDAKESIKVTDDSKKVTDNDKVSESTEQDDASTPEEGAEEKFDDPYEGYNRTMYAANKQIDKFLIKPPAQFYSYIIPSPVKYMVSNFFENIEDINVMINDFLQGEHYQVPKTFSRIFLNSTFGILGLIDVATDIGLPKRTNDFGITFGKWSMADSSYFVLPIMGPSTLRDTLGSAIGGLTTLGYYFPNDYAIPLTVLGLVDKRANLLSLEKIIDTISDDEYVFVRNSYLTYRNALIRGQKPNKKKEEKEEQLIDDILSSEGDNLDNELEELDNLEELNGL